MPLITSNHKHKELKHYSRYKIYNNCKCQKKIKANTLVQEKKIKEKIRQIETEDIVAEVIV